MAKYRVTAPDGTSYEVTAPDNATPDQVRAMVQKQEPKTSIDQKLRASPPARVLQGMRDPINAGAQLLPKGLEAVTGLFGFYPNKVSEFFGSEAQRVTNMNNAQEQQYQDARAATGQSGFDAFRFTGNVASPANLAIARAIPIAGGMKGGELALRGAAGGAASGALQPVEDMSDFWTAKAMQTGTGAAMGAVATPAVGALGNALAGRMPNTNVVGMLNRPEVRSKLIDEGLDPDTLPRNVLEELHRQATEAAKGGKVLDAAAALRKMDFDALKVKPLLGQITRDPGQFARERNLRGIEGAGEPILTTMSEQNRRLAELLRGNTMGIQTPMEAGKSAIGRLTGVDDMLKSRVDSLYTGARNEAGRYADVNVQQFSEAANKDLDEKMLGRFLPEQVKGLLNDVSSGKIPLNVNTLVQIDSVLSKAQRGADDAGALAIGQIRDALNKAQIADDAGVAAKGAFDAARKAARGRFKLQEAVPALKDAVDGKIEPEQFVKRYVIGDSTTNVRRLVKVLDPANRDQVAAQVGDYLQRAAFGPNPAGDAIFTPSRFKTALDTLGPEKLRAIFGEQKAAELAKIARVGGYINQTPGPAAVNYSNSGAAVANFLSKIPGMGQVGSAAKAVADTVVTPITRQRNVATSLAAEVPQTPAPLTPQSAKALATLLRLSGPAAGTAGVAAGPNF